MNNTTKVLGLTLTLGLAIVIGGFVFGTPKANACDNQTTYCYPETTGICESDKSRAKVGETVKFEATGQGGNGYYTYVWSGSDGLSDLNHRSYYIRVQYDTPGTKYAKVRITSNNDTVEKTCTVVIEDEEEEEDEDLTGYCVGKPSRPDEGDKVTWTANADGGTGRYEYEWSGTDGLDGDEKTITKRYNSSGTKTARVKITSGDQSITKTCNVKVQDEDKDDDDDLDAVCVPSKNTIAIGETVTFRVNASGGRNYEYKWSGTDGLRGDERSVSKSYSTAGTKTATVEVTSEDKDGDEDEVEATCRVNVQETYIYTPPIDNGIYLDTIPATGISASLKTTLFMTGLFLWSAFLGWMYLQRRNLKLKEQKIIEDAMNS
jgi:hypothetical protein